MKLFKPSRETVLFLLVLVIPVFLSSCGNKGQSAEEFIQGLPHVHPQKISQFQKADSIYFSHLNYKTIALENGTFLLPVRDPQALLQIDRKGKLQKMVARTGRGPGEVLDVLSVVKTKGGGVLAYDQKNQKVVRFDRQMNYKTEFSPTPRESAGIVGVYPTSNSETFLIELSPRDFLFDQNKNPRRYLSIYNAESDMYSEQIIINERSFARHIVDGQPVGGRYVPFANDQLLSYNREDQTLYTYWTGSSQIAELSADLDTIRTIPVDLPAQPLSSAERDSLKQDIQSQQWKTVSEKLPEVKAPVTSMKIDENGRFWLKLSYRSQSDIWLVMDREGNFQKIVHLPKGSMLTHVSGDHLGVRLDDITFALFEPVE